MVISCILTPLPVLALCRASLRAPVPLRAGPWMNLSPSALTSWGLERLVFPSEREGQILMRTRQGGRGRSPSLLCSKSSYIQSWAGLSWTCPWEQNRTSALFPARTAGLFQIARCIFLREDQFVQNCPGWIRMTPDEFCSRLFFSTCSLFLLLE